MAEEEGRTRLRREPSARRRTLRRDSKAAPNRQHPEDQSDLYDWFRLSALPGRLAFSNNKVAKLRKKSYRYIRSDISAGSGGGAPGGCNMDEKGLKEWIMRECFEEDGRKKLACADAFQIAERHAVELLDVARICNAENIRISRCQLGCFK